MHFQALPKASITVSLENYEGLQEKVHFQTLPSLYHPLYKNPPISSRQEDTNIIGSP